MRGSGKAQRKEQKGGQRSVFVKIQHSRHCYLKKDNELAVCVHSVRSKKQRQKIDSVTTNY